MNDLQQAGGEVRYRKEYGHFIDGEWVGGSNGQTIALLNPATGEELSRIQAGNTNDAVRAVDAASRAFVGWSKTTPAERQAALLEIANRLKLRANDIGMLESLNNGKAINEAVFFDLPTAIDQFLMFAGAAWDLHGTTLTRPDTIGIIHREPLGVCVQIIPWNAPILMMAAKIAPALAAGNTIVMKPSEIVCLSVMEFVAEIADVLPPGVLNVVTGYGPDVGEALVTHPKTRKVAFTGSKPTAQKLMQYAAVNIIPQTMELGGKSANIICDDADIDAAAEGAAMSLVFNKGEVCLSGTRVFVHNKIRDKFLDRLQAILSGIRIGDPLSPETQHGATASKAQFDKVMNYIDIGRAEGATLLAGGSRATGGVLDQGHYIQPTVFVDVDNQMRIAREEIFGPVAAVIGWSDEDELVRLANDSTYGLGGGLWTRDLSRAHRIAGALETGTIWVNRYYNFVAGMPIGGYKQSGFGREFCQEVLNHYTITKGVIINLADGPMGVFGNA